MNNQIKHTDRLPIDNDNRLRVHLVPMPSGESPARHRDLLPRLFGEVV